MSEVHLLPEIVRKEPYAVELRFRTDRTTRPMPGVEARLRNALHDAGLQWQPRTDGRSGCILSLPWQTAVLGLFRRRVKERVEVGILNGHQGPELQVYCRPDATHNAHAVGCSVMLMLAVATWVISGMSAEGVRAGVINLVIGSLLAVTTRRMAMTVLERRLQRLTGDLGLAVWPPPERDAPLPF